jgi:competence protein ComEA
MTLKRFFFPQLTGPQRKGLFLFSILILGAMGVHYRQFNHHSDRSAKDLRSGHGITIEIEGPVRRLGLLTYGQPPTVQQVIENAGGLLGPHALSTNATGKILDQDVRLMIIAGPDGLLSLRQEPLPAKACRILGRPIPLNQATIEDLDRLPEIGPKLAQRIIEFRKSRGGFSILDELKEVSGIKEKKFEKIKSYFIL